MPYNGSVYDKMTGNETVVSDFLKSIGLWWEFERPVYLLDDNERPRVWTPDFYLPELGIYIEVMGPNGNYEYRGRIYEKNKIHIVFVDPYNDDYWGHFLKDALWNIHNLRYKLLQEVTSNFKKLR